MTEAEYLEQRVDDQIAWYDRKSNDSRVAYRFLRVTEIMGAAAVPVLAAYTDNYVGIKVIIGLLGAAVAVIAGVLGLFQFQENWQNYRSTCEALRHEKFLFMTKTDPYAASTPFKLLVQRIEGLISQEHSNWVKYMGDSEGDEEQDQ